MLVFGVVFRHALGGVLAGLGIDLGGFGEGFERASWGLLGYFLRSLFHACFWGRLQKCFWWRLGWTTKIN